MRASLASPEVKKCNNFSRYEMRASRAIERAAFIVHESLRSCSKPLRRGSMHEERQNFLSEMQAIDPNLADSVSNVYVCVRSSSPIEEM